MNTQYNLCTCVMWSGTCCGKFRHSIILKIVEVKLWTKKIKDSQKKTLLLGRTKIISYIFHFKKCFFPFFEWESLRPEDTWWTLHMLLFRAWWNLLGPVEEGIWNRWSVTGEGKDIATGDAWEWREVGELYKQTLDDNTDERHGLLVTLEEKL